MRKIIQIAVAPGDIDVIFALCNDSTVWEKGFNDAGQWLKVKDIPQDGYQEKLTNEKTNELAREQWMY